MKTTKATPEQSISSTRGSPAPWSAQDDELLLALRQNDFEWIEIRDRFFPNRNWEDCMARHEELLL
jgi:hypothetical protein